MNKKIKIIIFFILILLILTFKCFAAPAYYYANTYQVTIFNVNKEDINKIEVLAPLSGGKKDSAEEEYEYVSSNLINYYEDSNIKCLKYKNVSELNFKDNACIIEIYDINDYQHEKNKTYFGGDVFLKIIKNDGNIIYTNVFQYYDVVDEFNSNDEWEEAKKFVNEIGKFECNFDNNKTILEVNLINQEDNESKSEMGNLLYRNVIILLVVILLVVSLIILIRKKK